jgi:hypothetical protein
VLKFLIRGIGPKILEHVYKIRASRCSMQLVHHFVFDFPKINSMATTHSVHSADVKQDDIVTTENIHSQVDYARNVDAKIVNPLAGIPRDQLRHKVDAFCESYGFRDKRGIFQKGALVAQDPAAFEDVPELAEEDKYHIRREITHKWYVTRDENQRDLH